jgi:hypothetical protein
MGVLLHSPINQSSCTSCPLFIIPIAHYSWTVNGASYRFLKSLAFRFTPVFPKDLTIAHSNANSFDLSLLRGLPDLRKVYLPSHLSEVIDITPLLDNPNIEEVAREKGYAVQNIKLDVIHRHSGRMDKLDGKNDYRHSTYREIIEYNGYATFLTALELFINRTKEEENSDLNKKTLIGFELGELLGDDGHSYAVLRVHT